MRQSKALFITFVKLTIELGVAYFVSSTIVSSDKARSYVSITKALVLVATISNYFCITWYDKIALTSSKPDAKIFNLNESGFLKSKLLNKAGSNSLIAKSILSIWLGPCSIKLTKLGSGSDESPSCKN